MNLAYLVTNYRMVLLRLRRGLFYYALDNMHAIFLQKLKLKAFVGIFTTTKFEILVLDSLSSNQIFYWKSA